jgi:hypothetical protein
MQPYATTKCNHMQPLSPVVGSPKRHNLLKMMMILRIYRLAGDLKSGRELGTFK